MKRKLILDFDGTLTDTDTDSSAYDAAFADEFTRRAEIEPGKLRSLLCAANLRIDNDPRAGWMHGGFVVAPADADPFVRSVTAYQGVCDALGMDSGKRDSLLGACYSTAYPKSETPFRAGIRNFLQKALEHYDPTVVTNSATEHVAQRFRNLDLPEIPIVGNARKYVVDPDWEGVPDSVHFPSFPRPVMLRKRHYAEALDSIGAGPGTTVMGDIYELDLALPDHKGMRTVQMTRDSTPKHEVEYMSSHPKGKVVRSLEEAGRFLFN